MRRASKLTRADDFRKAYSRGSHARTRTVVVHVRRREDATLEGPRVGVSAARAVGGAVRRNRAKRVLREAVRQVVPSLRPDVDAVLVATPETGGAGFQEVVTNAREGLRRAGGLA